MKQIPFSLRASLRAMLAVTGIVTLVACQSVPDTPPALAEARAALGAAESDPAIVGTAPLELQQAREAVALAEQRWAGDQDIEETRSLAHIARQRVAVARAVAERQVAEARVQQASVERERVRADVREREAKLARDRSVVAMEQAQQQQQQVAAARSQLDMARTKAQETEEQNRRLQSELEQLQAKQTSRGIVVTLGDVLFDTGRAELRGGALRSIERLATVLRDHPERRVVIEGYTDAQGSESFNLDLAERRAESVRRALLAQDVPADRVDVRAFGEANPVASNDTPAGRQLNRRVEIVFSNSSTSASVR